MKRFFFLCILAGGAVIGGHIALSAGTHPDHLATPLAALERSIALVFGAGLFTSGMLGLADSYERAATRFHQLLGAKGLPSRDDDLILGDVAQLRSHSHSFWLSYRKSGAAVCLFLAGLLMVTIALNQYSFELYVTGVAAGVACLGMVTFLLAYRGMRGMGRALDVVAKAVEALARQPDAQPATYAGERAIPSLPHALFKHSPAAKIRHVERRRRVPGPRVDT